MLIRDMCHFALRPMKSVQPRHKTNIDLIYEYIYPYISKIRSMSQNDQQPHRTTFPKARRTMVKLFWKRIVALTFQIQVAVDTSDSFKLYRFSDMEFVQKFTPPDFQAKILNRQFHLILIVLVRKNTKND